MRAAPQRQSSHQPFAVGRQRGQRAAAGERGQVSRGGRGRRAVAHGRTTVASPPSRPLHHLSPRCRLPARRARAAKRAPYAHAAPRERVFALVPPARGHRQWPTTTTARDTRRPRRSTAARRCAPLRAAGDVALATALADFLMSVLQALLVPVRERKRDEEGGRRRDASVREE